MAVVTREIRALCLMARGGAGWPDLPEELLDPPFDWEEVFVLAHRHEVVPLVWAWLRAHPASRAAVDPDVARRLERRALATAIRNRQRAVELARLLAAFDAAGVAVMPVKGIAIAESVYADVGLRTFDDIDLLTRRSERDAARAVLAGAGYRTRDEPRFEELHHRFHDLQYFRPLEGGVQCVELHWDLWSERAFASDIEGMWSRARPIRVAGTDTRGLADEDIILHLAIHRVSSALRLRFVCDVAELVRRRGTRIDWDGLERRATQVGARVALHMMLSLARQLLDAPVPDQVLARTRPGRVRSWWLDRTCGTRALFRPVPRDEVRQQPRLAYRILEQDRHGTILRSVWHGGARKLAKARHGASTGPPRRAADPTPLDGDIRGT